MGSHRNMYPSGAASASAAFRCAGDGYEAALLGLSNPLGLQGSMYGYDLTLFTGRGSDRGFCPSHGRSLLTQNGSIDAAAVYSEADLHGPELLTGSVLTDFHGFNGDTRVSHGQSLYNGGSSFNFLSAETDMHAYCCSSDTYINSMYRRQQAERTPQTSVHAPARKRKTLSFDEIVRETWELHSLFRAGQQGAFDITECSSDDIIFTGQWDKPSLPKKPALDETWHVPSNGLFDTTSSWKALDLPTIEREETTLNIKLKDSLDIEQQQHASDLQRLTCEKVAEFMGNYSDGDSSDNDSFADSDDDTPNVVADSPCDAKSREEKAFTFFLQTFVESEELQKLYSEQCHVGKFDCLVCSSIPGKPVKKFNGLISVIMHASKIIKTKKKQEHRGYARALCSAMGWDLCRLPSMPCSSSPHPRCCIPTNEEEGMDVKKTNGVMKTAQKEL
ncbi:hypothetical protein GOP47_0015018 [Adiantum capillus-veneris]|uniref:Uncharacterized protein n=1 Tax=Adiantum capillus-veneris TaxID=13818 RepID=A0A9D4ZET1_ADICA|nr:hypothetical protein GOP47_0015018 [Adiantum capillus-veneris]